MNRRLIVLCLLFVVAACRERSAPTGGGDPQGQPGPDVKLAQQAVSQTRESLREVTDIMVRQVALEQVVAVYLVAGLGKIDGELWQNGTALYYTLSVDDFTLPLARRMVAQYPFLSVAGSYATLPYQVAFPWLIWNPKARPYLMAFGTFLHLQIALVMGLFTFGLAVMASYAIFFTDGKSAAVMERCAAMVRRVSGMVPRPAPLPVAT